MEDSLLGAERLEHSMKVEPPKGGSKEVDDREEEDDKKENEAKGGGEERGSGFINHLLSNLVSGSGEGEEGKAGEKDDEVKRGMVSEEGVDDEDKGGGFIRHLISNLVSSHSPKAGKDSEQKVEALEGNNGGSKAEEDGNGGRLQKGKSKEESGGGGIIENLVSHLPAPLLDDVAPSPDEASILIHSIIHD